MNDNSLARHNSMSAFCVGVALLMAPAARSSEVVFPLQAAHNNGMAIFALQPPLKAALVSPMGAPEWVKDKAPANTAGSPALGERLAKVRFRVLDSYPTVRYSEVTCYVAVARDRHVPLSSTFEALPTGRYVLTYTDHDADGKLVVPECFRGAGSPQQGPREPVEADAVCGGSLAPTDAVRLAAGRDLAAVVLRSYVEALKSGSGASVRTALVALARIHAPVGMDKRLAGLVPGRTLLINGVPAERFYLDDLAPRVLQIANGCKPARKLAMYGLLSRWGVELDGTAAIDALLCLAKEKDWDGFDLSSSDMRALFSSVQIAKGDGATWLRAVEAMPPGAWQLFALRQFGPIDLKEQEWPRLLRVAMGADEAASSICLGWLRIFSGNQSELVRLSEPEQMRYWRSRLGVNP